MTNVLMFLAVMALVLVAGARLAFRQARAERDADPDHIRFVRVESGDIR